MKKYSITRVFIILYFTYFCFTIFREYHPIFYGSLYNNKRIEVGIKPIDENLKRTRDKTSRNQLWLNQVDTIPRFYSKYTSFTTWHGGIEMENDNYLVKIDTTKIIVSINYNFKTKKYDFTLNEYKRRKVIDVYGYPGKIIRELEIDEVVEILKNNGIKCKLQHHI